MPTSSLLLGLLAVASAPALALALAPGSLVNLPAGWKAGETVDAKYVVYNAKNSDAGRECVCASSFDAAHDYFPVKLGAESRAAGFTVTYHNSYKVINNTAAGVVHVGYQCGTPKPTEQALGFKPTAFVELPVSTIGVASTTDLPWIEFLGDRAAIKAVPGFGVTSACVKKMVVDGSAVVYSAKATKGLGHDINLCSQGWGCSGVANAVPIGANTETSVLGTASWIEYIAAFLNRERAAQDVVRVLRRKEAECVYFTCVWCGVWWWWDVCGEGGRKPGRNARSDCGGTLSEQRVWDKMVRVRLRWDGEGVCVN